MIKKAIVLILLSALNLLGQELTWVNPGNVDVRTVFYQGMNSSQTQAAKYAGSNGFIATTGELVVNDKGIHTIQNVHVEPEIDEVCPAPRASLRWSELTLNPMSIIYGLGKRLCHFVTQHSNASYGTRIIQTPDQNIDRTIAYHSLNVSTINIAQDGDIRNHRNRFNCCVGKYPENDVILYGVSRGAATTFQSLATMAKENCDISKIKLCILEGCFDDVASVMRNRHPWLLGSDRALNVTAAIASMITSYRIDGPSPIKAVEDFPKTVPVAFITSKKDVEVPMSCTQRVVDKLREVRHTDVHTLVLEKSSHPRYMFDDKDDAAAYQNFIHALYEKYSLPHIPQCAREGEKFL